ncbi:MAG: hypothetical protein WBG65_00425 [Sulfurimonadaceae bacterium]
MPYVNVPPHNLEPNKVQLAIDKLNELEKSNKKLKMELMKFSINGGYDAVYSEMKKRGLLP